MSSSELPFEPLLEPQQEPASGWKPLWDVGGDGQAAAGEAQAAPEPPPAAAVEPGEPKPAAEERERSAFAAGYELGREEMRAQVESVAESFVKSLEELAAFRARLRDRYERELLELALGVARKVVHRDVQERPEAWLGMIRAAVRQAVDREHIRIRVPGSLASFLRERLPELRAQLEEVREIELVEDPGLRAGGCIIETRYGELDLGLDTQIDEIERQLLRVETPLREAGEGAGTAAGGGPATAGASATPGAAPREPGEAAAGEEAER